MEHDTDERLTRIERWVALHEVAHAAEKEAEEALTTAEAADDVKAAFDEILNLQRRLRSVTTELEALRAWAAGVHRAVRSQNGV